MATVAKGWQGTVGDIIAYLIKEGKDPKQAEAIALEMGRQHGVVKSDLSLTVLKVGDRRIALAVTNVVTDRDGTPVVDHQGDVIGIDNLEDAFIEAFADGGVNKGGAMHTHNGGADIVQQMTISRAEWAALEPYIGQEIGLVKIRVSDDTLWALVKSGKLPEVSIGGTGRREPV